MKSAGGRINKALYSQMANLRGGGGWFNATESNPQRKRKLRQQNFASAEVLPLNLQAMKAVRPYL